MGQVGGDASRSAGTAQQQQQPPAEQQLRRIRRCRTFSFSSHTTADCSCAGSEGSNPSASGYFSARSRKPVAIVVEWEMLSSRSSAYGEWRRRQSAAPQLQLHCVLVGNDVHVSLVARLLRQSLPVAEGLQRVQASCSAAVSAALCRPRLPVS